jgi:hypothetical protein
MHLARRPLTLMALSFCAACVEPVRPAPAADAQFTLETADVWAGDTIVVRSDWYATLGAAAATTVTLTLGGDTLPAWYAGGDSLAAFAPATARSGAPLVVRFPGGVADLGPVSVYGYLDDQAGPPVGGVFLPWPLGSPAPSLLAYGREGMVRVDLRFGTATVLALYDSASPMSCNWGPAPTNRPNAVVMCRRVWSLAPAPSGGDSVPYPSDRLTAVLAGEARIDLGHHSVSAHNAQGWVIDWGTEEADEIRVSPSGDRVAIKTWGGFHAYLGGPPPPAGYPVWDSLGNLAYAVQRLDSVGVVPGFSLTGDTLFAATVTSDTPPDTLFVIRAADGTVLGAVALPPEFIPRAVAPDPDAPRVYVYGWLGENNRLAVVDLSSARLESLLLVPWFAEFGGENPEIAFDRGRRELYVAFGDNRGSSPLTLEELRPLYSIRFTLLP